MQSEDIETSANNRTHVHPRSSLLARDKLIAALGRQEHRRGTDAARYQNRHTPANRTQYPRRIQFPSGEEPVIVVVKICLPTN